MKKKLLTIIILIILLSVGFFVFWPRKTSNNFSDFKDSSFIIDGQIITLKNGKSEMPAAPGSASMIETSYFGNEAKGDLNGDGLPDAAFLVTQSTGGSGTFYYVVAAIQNPNGGYGGTEAYLLGDRIAPQTTEIKDGQIVVNYADRKPTDSMTTQPSVGVTKYLIVQGNLIVSVK